MALTLYYVDPVGGSDSTGNGTIGAPWKSTQKALNTITQGAGGDQINIKAGGDDVLTATLSVATYGTPTSAKPLIFRGYTSAANDGGIGGISGNSGGFTIHTSTATCVDFVDMHLHHTGASPIVTLGVGGGLSFCINCEFDHSTSGTAVQAIAINCYFHDLSGSTALVRSAVFCRFDFSNGTCPSGGVINTQGFAVENEFRLPSSPSPTAMAINGGSVLILGNSIYSAGSTGKGIDDLGFVGTTIVGNIVEGFSGAGGTGIKTTLPGGIVAGNRAFNNTTNYNLSPNMFAATNYSDSATNFTSASTGDLSLAVGSGARGVSYPGTYPGSPTQTSYRDAGALQHQDAGGGGGVLVNPGMGGF